LSSFPAAELFTPVILSEAKNLKLCLVARLRFFALRVHPERVHRERAQNDRAFQSRSLGGDGAGFLSANSSFSAGGAISVVTSTMMMTTA